MSNKTKELRKSNNLLDKEINENNQAIFTDIICYIRGSNISDYNQELVRQDLSEMIISAQERGEAIENVIGRDYKEFCDEVIANFPNKTIKEKTIDMLDIFFSSMAILTTINILFSKDLYRIIDEIISNKSVNFNIGISVGALLSMIIIITISTFIVYYITKNIFNKVSDSSSKKTVKGIIIGAILGFLFICIMEYGEQIVLSINIFLALVLVVFFYVMHKLLGAE